MKGRWPSLLWLACLLCLPIPCLAGGMLDGEWLVTTSIRIPGMGSMPGGTHRHCYDDQDSPYPARADERCHLVSMKQLANTVQWHVHCQTSSGESEIRGETTRTGEQMHGSMHITSADGNMDMVMDGRYLGPCAAHP